MSETIEQTTWACDNCGHPNDVVRRRCTDCGITRD